MERRRGSDASVNLGGVDRRVELVERTVQSVVRDALVTSNAKHDSPRPARFSHIY